MELHNLKPAPGSVKKGKRIARGQGSGHGGTATRGHKGAKSRSGYSRKKGFEGGQMPLQQRLPKRGFKNPNRVEYVPINVNRLQELADMLKTGSINIEVLISQRAIRKNDLVKILGDGELKSKVDVTVHACSASAKQAIEAAGGSVNLV
jgi:large subunit ribosomal protein L15